VAAQINKPETKMMALKRSAAACLNEIIRKVPASMRRIMFEVRWSVIESIKLSPVLLSFSAVGVLVHSELAWSLVLPTVVSFVTWAWIYKKSDFFPWLS
jgi:hypothetical protein